nr:unnamed protein product [Spirometra erinaceieuropaei]
MPDPSLKHPCLLGEYRTAVGAEKRSSASGWWTVDSLDRGEETLPFVAVCIPLDLTGVASPPGLLPLLHEAATTAEGCPVVFGEAAGVRFVQSVFLDK